MKTLITTLSLLLLPFAASAQVNVNTTSSATTQSQSAAQNAGNEQKIIFTGPDTPGHTSANVRNVPSIVGPGLYGSFSSDSCTTSAGGSAAWMGFGGNLAVPVKDDQCNSRRNVTLMMQVSNNLRPFNAKQADAVARAAMNVLCRSDNDVYAALQDAGLCDPIDYERYKKEDRQPPAAYYQAPPPQALSRGPALAYLPNTGGQ
jgi:hypothetical protein